MSGHDRLVQAFAQLAFHEATLHPAIVKAVDEEKMSCQVEMIGSEILNDEIRLRASVPEESKDTPEGYYLIPAIDSVVHVCFLDDGIEGCVVIQDKVAKVLYVEEATRITINKEGFESKTGEDVVWSLNKKGNYLTVGDSTTEVVTDLVSIASGDKIEIKNQQVTLKEIIAGLITVISKIVVVQGVSPDIGKLADLNMKLSQLMK